MINYFTKMSYISLISFMGIIFSFIVTCFCMSRFNKLLPRDLGREFAHDGKLSAGKPRGAGFIFILVFVISTIIFAVINTETSIYLILISAAMLTGFLDDAAKNPWGEYRKGLLDLAIAVMIAITFLNFNSNVITLAFLDITITIPPILFGLLAVILVWVSINVTNCSDGVDGLSGTLTIITIVSIYVINNILTINADFNYLILLFTICILGYLWFNATPSVLMMGDAGSRAMGLFISIAILKTGSPLLYIPVALLLIIDGGTGLVKVALLRFFKIHIFKNTQTPFHDHFRKVRGWSNTQTVFRFAIMQIIVSIITIYLITL